MRDGAPHALGWLPRRAESSTLRRYADDAGFTLVEMLIVISIMAFVMTLAVIQLSGAQGKAELEAGAREIASALREVRSHAITFGRREAFVLDTSSGTYRAGEASAPQQLPKGVRSTLLTTTQERINQVVGRIEFFPDGSSTGGGVHLTRGSRQSDVHVDWLSGRISTNDVSLAGQ
jgi:general secretion pathway protein H